jgi:hypothetical protein
MARSRLRSLRLSDKDLDFLVETASPGVIDKPKPNQILREDEKFRNTFIDDEKVFRRLMDEEEIFLRISPALFFEILLRKVARDLKEISYTITLVQNSFFTTESQRAQRDNFYLAGRYRQIKSLLSLQNRDPTLCQSPVRRLRFYSRREGIYDPIAASRLDHKKSSSVYSVPPW